jgi:hypothetical protein
LPSKRPAVLGITGRVYPVQVCVSVRIWERGRQCQEKRKQRGEAERSRHIGRALQPLNPHPFVAPTCAACKCTTCCSHVPTTAAPEPLTSNFTPHTLLFSCAAQVHYLLQPCALVHPLNPSACSQP